MHHILVSKLSPPDAAAHAARALSLQGQVRLLASERDLTFLLDAGNERRCILKICHPDETAEMTTLQLHALSHLKNTAPALPVPRILANQSLTYADGLTRETYALSWLPGTPLHERHGGAAQAFALGQMMAEMARALSTLSAPLKAPQQVWDISNALDIAPKLDGLSSSLRTQVEPVLEEFAAIVKPSLARLPAQLIHNDFNPHNLFVDEEDPAHITGVIDFGDIALAPRVNDLAVALSYRLPHAALRDTIPDWLAGYENISPLTEAERRLLPRLIRTRMAMTVTIASWRVRQTPQNAAYILRYRDGAMRCLAAGNDVFNGLFSRTHHG
ncbi:phosphotransferase [Acidocella sp.]|uniref:phosphotransferase n=1 Tax=Acidocella sp. TaxID=50710 RepID=UPI003CFE25B2